jgi:hypothetical protein
VHVCFSGEVVIAITSVFVDVSISTEPAVGMVVIVGQRG